MKYTITNDRETVRHHQKTLGDASWPEFMQHDDIVEKYWPTLYDNFSEFQFAVFDNETIVGIGNMIPLYWNKPLDELPSRGVDWAMEKANSDFENNIEPNLLVAMQILINQDYRGKGISAEMVKNMKVIGAKNAIGKIALPIRPTIKHKYPLIPMIEYANWKREDGKAFDAWIRVHSNLGGEIVGICEESMYITGTVKEWEKWSGLRFPKSGINVIPNALVPVNIDLEKNIGIYIEPNVWMIHKTT